MKLFTRRKQITDKPSPSRRKRKAPRQTWTRTFLASSPIVTALILSGWVVLTILLAFTGVTPAGIQVLPNEVSRVRVVAETDFSYTSELQTRRKIEVEKLRIPPVFRMDMTGFETFREYIGDLVEGLNDLGVEVEGFEEEALFNRVEKFALDFEENTPLRLNVEDVMVLLTRTEAKNRGDLMDQALVSVRSILSGGIYNPDVDMLARDQENLNFIYVQRESGQPRRLDIQSQEMAFGALKRDFTYFDITQDLNIALSRIMSQALQPNLEYDPELHETKRREIEERAEPVEVNVMAGETIIEPGETVLAHKYEMLLAYQDFMRQQDFVHVFSLGKSFWEKALITLLLCIGVVVYLSMAGWSKLSDNRQGSLLFLVILINIAIARLLLAFSDNTPTLYLLLRYMVPIYLGPIIIALLINQRAAIFVSSMVCFITCLMFGDSFEFMAVTFLACLVAVLGCSDVRKRGHIMRASLLGGAAFAMGGLILGLINEVSLVLIGKEMLVALGVGLATGILVIGVLPFFEGLFQMTTNITLLELTDYNHRLLRRLQLEAPGSYHHSLMVANLAENGASAIGAKPLVCRVCSLFHDIGKLVKPEYFVENQRDGENPLILHNPSMAALIIKSHVKEGVNLAVRNKLPKVIINVIKQHHGTSLITFFYVEALKGGKYTGPEGPRVEESTYRYDGPKPQFKESAVIFFADAVEAASRSLTKITPQSISDLIDTIFEARIADDQLSDCPLTFEEIKKLTNSFAFTLINTLHSRIEYPDKDKALAEAGNGGRQNKKRSNIQSLQSI